MVHRFLLPLVLLLAGCSNPPEATEVLFPPDATGMMAEDFMAEVVGREFPLDAFIHEYGAPAEVEQEDGLSLLYDCRDYSVSLTVNREKFKAGIVEVIEGEPY